MIFCDNRLIVEPTLHAGKETRIENAYRNLAQRPCIKDRRLAIVTTYGALREINDFIPQR